MGGFSLIPQNLPASTNNPVLDEITRAHAQLSDPAKLALHHAGLGAPQPQAAERPTMAAPSAPAPKMAMPTPAQSEYNRLNETGSGVSQIHSPWARVPLHIAEGIGNAFAPAITQSIPGTQLHHNMLLSQAKGAVDTEDTLKNTQARRGLEGAQQAEQESLPALHESQNETKREHDLGVQQVGEAKNETNRLKNAADEVNKRREIDQKIRGAGYDPESGEPLPYEQLSEQGQAIHDWNEARTEMSKATADLRKAQASGNTPAQQLAQQRLDSASQAHQIAERRLSLSEKQFEMRAHGTEGGQALPGAILDDQNEPVGTGFQQNVRPTGTERSRADLAKSATEQLNDIRSIVKRHPDFFGPGAGRATAFQNWIGSEDPEAKAFLTARTILADHAAGVFGARSAEATRAQQIAAGELKDNPEAILRGLEQIEKAMGTIGKIGTPKTVGSNAAGGATPTVKTQAEYDALPKGSLYMEDGKQYRKP